MAQTQKCKQMHEEQVAAAQELFQKYINFIIEEFVAKFGTSYETAKYFLEKENEKKEKRQQRKQNKAQKSNKEQEGKIDTWQVHYDYTPEREEFLIERSKTFIHVAPSVERKYQSPAFLRNLTSLISEYLSSYVEKKGIKRNDCTKYLQEILFDKNEHVQKETGRYVAKNNREWGLQQKAKRERAEEKRRKAARKNDAVLVEVTPEQKTKLRHDFLKQEIQKKRNVLQTPPRPKTEEEKALFHAQIEANRARRKLEKQQQALQIQISIKGIIK